MQSLIINQTNDPTRTAALIRRAFQRTNGKFIRINAAIRKKIVDENVLGGTPDPLDTNAPKKRKYTYEYVPLGNTPFQLFMENLVDKELDLRRTGEYKNFWLSTFVGSGYDAGIKATRSGIKKQVGDSIQMLPLDSALNNPAHLERAQAVFTRTFNGMKGVGETMTDQMRSELAQGVLEGRNPIDIAASIKDRVNKIGRTRTRLIARTEIINAHQGASIQEVKNLQESFGSIELKMRWNTTMDGNERPDHAERNGQIYTTDEAEALIGEPNCRCSVDPYLPDFDDAEDRQLPVQI